MISPEEKIYSPETNMPQNSKVNVPNKFEYVEPKNLGSKHLPLKKFIIAGAFVVSMIVAVAIVVIVSQNEDISKLYLESTKLHNLFSHPKIEYQRN